MSGQPTELLRFEHVSKRYWIRQDATVSAAGFLSRIRRKLSPPRVEFWAVRDVSFGIRRGESVGIIGHNGAGKSTILKMLSNITAPSAGRIVIQGRIAALLEVGSGFHPELSGIENIYLSGSILGMTRAEINSKLDAIVDFAEVRQFLDVPVKHYSSGMFVRLGFAIAAHLTPEILLLDEVLAVGDARFQEKCRTRIQSLRDAGTTIVFVSHDLAAVEQVCDRVLLLKKGEIVADGLPGDVIEKYHNLSAVEKIHHRHIGAELSGKTVRVTHVKFIGGAAAGRPAFRTGGSFTLRVDFCADQFYPGAVIQVFFYSTTDSSQPQCHFTTVETVGRVDLAEGPATVEFHCPYISLQPGMYTLGVTIEGADPLLGSDWARNCATMIVEGARRHRLFRHAIRCFH